MAPNPALPWPPAAPSKGIDPETSSPYGAPLFGAGTGGFAVPGSAAKAPNEFSRIVTPDRLGAPKLVEYFEASPAERAAVVRRLELLAVDRLADELQVTNVGGRLFRDRKSTRMNSSH